jgi:PAS domain-containing protein
METGPDQGLGRVIESAKRDLERMIDLSPVMMLLVGRDGRVLRTNRAVLEVLGAADFPSVLGRHFWDLFPCETEAREGFLERYDGFADRECWCPLGGRGRRRLHCTIVGTGDEEDPRVLIIEDVTAERAREEADVKEHKRAAVEALAGALKHRINQSLTVINVRARLVLMALEQGDVDNAVMRQSLEDITRLAMEISQVLNDAEHPRSFVTESYLPNMEILDIGRSAAGGAGTET